jgi:hypothetical protein
MIALQWALNSHRLRGVSRTCIEYLNPTDLFGK